MGGQTLPAMEAHGGAGSSCESERILPGWLQSQAARLWERRSVLKAALLTLPGAQAHPTLPSSLRLPLPTLRTCLTVFSSTSLCVSVSHL